MDGRKGRLIVRARLTMGNGWPPDMGPVRDETSGVAFREVANSIGNFWGNYKEVIKHPASFL